VPEDTFLKPREVADWLGIHVNTVKRLGDSGEMKFFRIGKRGDRRYRAEDVNEYLVRRSALGGRNAHRNARGPEEVEHDGVLDQG
jgi:excisionase family DNA binding protein